MKVAQTCLALHVSHQFTHFAATDGGKDHEDKLEEDGKYVPNPRVACGVFEGPTRFGRRVPGDAQVKEPNGIGPCGEEEIRTAFGAGMWGGKLPSTWEPIDAEMYAILAYLRKMASARDAQSRRCLVLCDCKPALQQIESAYRKGMPEGLIPPLGCLFSFFLSFFFILPSLPWVVCFLSFFFSFLYFRKSGPE